MHNNDLIDLAKEWIEKRGGAYLAKENVIVYYTSTTGRKSDFKWITHSLVEVVRIIRATLMNSDNSDKFQSSHLIAACQELDRVFEFGMKSRHVTKPEIFNYLLESGMDIGDSVVTLVVEELYAQGYKAIFLSDVHLLIAGILYELNVKVPVQELRDMINKHFPTLGYEVRTGSSRPEYLGKKQSAVMLATSKPRELVFISKEVHLRLVTKIVGALK